MLSFMVDGCGNVLMLMYDHLLYIVMDFKLFLIVWVCSCDVNWVFLFSRGVLLIRLLLIVDLIKVVDETWLGRVMYGLVWY